MGHWFITPNFFSFVDENVFYSIPEKERKTAFNEAGHYMFNNTGQELKFFMIYTLN
jgi:hypothetical protein